MVQFTVQYSVSTHNFAAASLPSPRSGPCLLRVRVFPSWHSQCSSSISMPGSSYYNRLLSTLQTSFFLQPLPPFHLCGSTDWKTALRILSPATKLYTENTKSTSHIYQSWKVQELQTCFNICYSTSVCIQHQLSYFEKFKPWVHRPFHLPLLRSHPYLLCPTVDRTTKKPFLWRNKRSITYLVF